MALEIKKLDGSETEISIEVPAEEFEKIYNEVFKEAIKGVSLEGFRPGKVPEDLAKKNIDEENILKKAAEAAIRKSYFPVLMEKKIEAIGRPFVTITKIAKGDSFCFKVRTAVLPQIILPDYRKIAKDIRAKEEEVPTPEGQDPDATGRSVGEKTIEEIKKRQKRQLDMLEAISAGSKMEIPEILVLAEKEKMLAELKSSIENMGMSWADYLVHLKKSDLSTESPACRQAGLAKAEDDLRKDWQEDAMRRVKYGLILRELAEKENIQVEEKELESRVNEILKQGPKIDKGYLRGYTYGILRNEKVFKFLENI
ncbi:MAG: trigger factor [bacterium]|nr:trigger factor [bacterium]